MIHSKPKDSMIGDRFDYNCPTREGHRYPRTLTEAFGPYTSSKIEDPPSSVHGWIWWVISVVFSVIAVLVNIIPATAGFGG